MTAGRKLEFDKNEALDRAMRLFWEHGFAATSLSELVSELGISKPSLYNTFGNKEALFWASFEHYRTEYVYPKFDALTQLRTDPLEVRLKRYYYALIDLMTDSDTPTGCLYVRSQAEAQSPSFPAELSKMMVSSSDQYHRELATFLEEEISLGMLSERANVSEISNYIVTVGFGIAVQSRSGKSKPQLRSIADIAVATIVH